MTTTTKAGANKAPDVKRRSDLRAQKILQRDERFSREASQSAAAAELLMSTSGGFLEPEGPMERTWNVKQEQLRKMVDVQSSKKSFELKLDAKAGPYRASYTRNGRHVLLGGQQGGHLSGFDWQTGRLRFEIQLEAGEVVRDVSWLQNETFFAAAQRKFVYMYDHAGVEVHRLKHHSTAERLTFLPYHHLLASSSRDGHLRYTDVTTGQMAADLPYWSNSGACTTSLVSNPRSGIMHMGHANGTVTFWSPKSPVPLVKLLAHQGPVLDLAVDLSGQYLATAGNDGSLKIWDLRSYQQPYGIYHCPGQRVSSLAFSQRGLLAVGQGPRVAIWRGITKTRQKAPYMNHLLPASSVSSLAFCPFEDVLGVGHAQGFASLLIPGAGEPNYDSLEANPFATAKQRREAEIHGLLDKLPLESIVMDPDLIGRVRRAASETIDEDMALEDAANASYGKPPKKEKNRAKGRNSSLKRYMRKCHNIVDDRKHDAVKVVREDLQTGTETGAQSEPQRSALSRFVRKDN